MPDGWVVDHVEGQTAPLERRQDIPGAVGAAVVEDDQVIRHGGGVADEGLDDVDLVLHTADGNDAHVV